MGRENAEARTRRCPVGLIVMGTIRVKPSHPSQGEYVVIEESDFDSKIHEKLGETSKRRGRPPKKLKEQANGNS